MELIEIKEEHYPQVASIYAEGIATGQATFELSAPSWTEWDLSKLNHSRIGVKANDQLIGWAALSKVSDRCVYGGVAEVSIYISESHRGKGVGRMLFTALIEQSEKHGLWTLQSGVFPENEATVKLHKALGFREVGFRERIGKLNGVWRDTLLLERRSKINGIN